MRTGSKCFVIKQTKTRFGFIPHYQPSVSHAHTTQSHYFHNVLYHKTCNRYYIVNYPYLGEFR